MAVEMRGTGETQSCNSRVMLVLEHEGCRGERVKINVCPSRDEV